MTPLNLFINALRHAKCSALGYSTEFINSKSVEGTENVNGNLGDRRRIGKRKMYLERKEMLKLISDADEIKFTNGEFIFSNTAILNRKKMYHLL